MNCQQTMASSITFAFFSYHHLEFLFSTTIAYDVDILYVHINDHTVHIKIPVFKFKEFS